MQKTDRNSEALSQALDSLIQSHLIEAKSASGKSLPTTALRRQIRGRILYALHLLLIQRISGNEQTEVGGQAVDNFTKSEHETSKTELTGSIFRQEGRKIEHWKVDKPNRTKETETKRVFFQMDKFGDTLDDLDSLFDEERMWSQADFHQLPSSMWQFIDLYSQRYARHFPSATMPVIFASALKRLSGVLEKYSQSELAELLDLFFLSDLPNVKRQWYSLEAFVHNIDILKKWGDDL